MMWKTLGGIERYKQTIVEIIPLSLISVPQQKCTYTTGTPHVRAVTANSTTRAQYTRDVEPVNTSPVCFEFSTGEQRDHGERAMASPYEPDRPVICPYNESHSIAQSRLQKHLVKCSRNYPPNYKVSCPHNATHRFFEKDLAKHILECPDRQILDKTTWEPMMHHNCGVVRDCREMKNSSVIECDESWDAESDDRDTPNSSVYQFDTSIDSNFEPMPCRQKMEPIGMFTTCRPPMGRSAALMMEESGDSAQEDIESVTSSACMGRGKPLQERNLQLLSRLRKGRGSGQPKSGI